MKRFLVLFALTNWCQALDLKVGTPAPALNLSRLLQAPPRTEVSWQALKGQALVLEFWATWCGGCRDTIPHLNKLEQQFRDRRVHFLSITDEGQEIVQRFLKDYPITGWVGLDSDEKTFKAFSINGRPTTVLVDALGVVRGIGNASSLRAETIEKLLAGQPTEFEFSKDAPTENELQLLPQPFYQAMVRPAGPVAVTRYSPGAVSGVGGRRWETWGVGLKRLLSDAYGIPENRIIVPADLSTERYDVHLAAPALTVEKQKQVLRRTLEETFQLTVRQEARETDVYVLTAIKGFPTKLQPVPTGESRVVGKQGDLKGISVSVGSIAGSLGRALEKVVINETKLEGRFDFVLQWDVIKPESLIRAVREQLGLELIPVRRPLDYLVVMAATKPAAW